MPTATATTASTVGLSDHQKKVVKIQAICQQTDNEWLNAHGVYGEDEMRLDVKYAGFLVSYRELQTVSLTLRPPPESISDKWYAHNTHNLRSLQVDVVQIYFGTIGGTRSPEEKKRALFDLVQRLMRSHPHCPIVTYDNACYAKKWLDIGFRFVGGQSDWGGNKLLIYTQHIMNGSVGVAYPTTTPTRLPDKSRWSYCDTLSVSLQETDVNIRALVLTQPVTSPDESTRTLIRDLRRAFPLQYIVLRCSKACVHEWDNHAQELYFRVLASDEATEMVTMLCIS